MMMPRLALVMLFAACGASNTPPATMCPAGGVPDDPDVMEDGCEVLHEGCCYRDSSDACRAAGCGDECVILESYPGQVQCGS